MKKIVKIICVLILFALSSNFVLADVVVITNTEKVTPMILMALMLSFVALFILLIFFVDNNKRINKAKESNMALEEIEKLEINKTKYLIGLTICTLLLSVIDGTLYWVNEYLFGLVFLLPIGWLTIVIIMLIFSNKENIKKRKSIKVFIISGFVIAFVVPFLFGVPLEKKINRLAGYEKREAAMFNNPFESYFGTDMTVTEVKNLLVEIKYNNLANETEGNPIIYVCFISKKIEANNENGIYSDLINPDQLQRHDLDNYTFTSDTSKIVEILQRDTSYTVNVPSPYYSESIKAFRWLWPRNN